VAVRSANSDHHSPRYLLSLDSRGNRLACLDPADTSRPLKSSFPKLYSASEGGPVAGNNHVLSVVDEHAGVSTCVKFKADADQV
jgi:hypothetical protein